MNISSKEERQIIMNISSKEERYLARLLENEIESAVRNLHASANDLFNDRSFRAEMTVLCNLYLKIPSSQLRLETEANARWMLKGILNAITPQG